MSKEIQKDEKKSAEQLQKEAVKKQEDSDKKLIEALPKDEQKIVKKRMKKTNMSAKQAIFSRFLEQNQPKADKLYKDFVEQFNGLGFYLKAYLEKTDNALTAKLGIDALTVDGFDQLQQFYINKNKKDDKKSEGTEKKATEKAGV